MPVLPSQLIVFVDSREQQPLQFPSTIQVLDPNGPAHTHPSRRLSVHPVPQRLVTGDYALQGFEAACLVERKGSIREVAQNVLTSDRSRFIATLERLRSSCRYPVLLFEGDARSLLTATSRVPHPGLAVDSLIQLMLEYGITFFTFRPSSMEDRRRMGELVIRTLLAGALSCQTSSKTVPHPSSTVAQPRPLPSASQPPCLLPSS